MKIVKVKKKKFKEIFMENLSIKFKFFHYKLTYLIALATYVWNLLKQVRFTQGVKFSKEGVGTNINMGISYQIGQMYETSGWICFPIHN